MTAARPCTSGCRSPPLGSSDSASRRRWSGNHDRQGVVLVGEVEAFDVAEVVAVDLVGEGPAADHGQFVDVSPVDQLGMVAQYFALPERGAHRRDDRSEAQRAEGG